MTSQEAMPTEPSLPAAPEPSFHDAVAQAIQIVESWLVDPNQAVELDPLPEGVFVRNLDGTLVLSNAAYRGLFEPGQASAGRSSRIYLSDDLRRISEATDALLLDGVKSIEMHHEFDGAPGQRYDLLVYKRLLRGAEHPPYLVGVLRALARYETGVQTPRHDLKSAARVMGGFDEVDLKICRGICGGATNQALSAELGMTTRAIEMRRQKILSQLGLNHTVGLVKLLVRLQDRGYLDLGI
jgi:hypothetical protein